MQSPSQRAAGRYGHAAWLVLWLAGCGGSADGLPREPVTGTVTLDGQPLKNGTIQFQPAGQSKGIPSAGTVTEGRFEVPRAEGPVPGKYSVSIFANAGVESSSAESTAPAPPSAANRKKLEDLRGAIPSRYNSQTELVAEVKSGGPNQFTFDLKK